MGTEQGLGLVQPEDTEILSNEELLDHDDPSHVCHRQCCKWEDPDWPESCGDED